MFGFGRIQISEGPLYILKVWLCDQTTPFGLFHGVRMHVCLDVEKEVEFRKFLKEVRSIYTTPVPGEQPIASAGWTFSNSPDTLY
jgi:hypothetical protein